MSVVTLGSNIASLKAQRQLGKATADVRTVSERLSSGLRINHASDDAAGLSIASSLNADRRVFEQGVRNLNDGISLLNVADGATEQLSTILIRLKELAEQSANGTYGVKQRKALDSEAQALSKEYFRIVQTTSFNGQSLFSPAFGQLRVQGGYGANGGIQGSLGGAVGTGQLGGYSSLPNSSSSDSTPGVALGDVNGDGILDLGNLGSVSLGLGDGTFQQTLSFGGSNSAILFEDLNNDGFLDILLSAGADFTVRLGNGNGTFKAGTNTTSLVASYSIAAADFNGDGILDIARGTGTLEILLGRGDGTFGAGITRALTHVHQFDLAVGDLNGDGLADIAMAGDQSAVFISRGDGTFGAETNFATPGYTYAVEFADFNNDAFLDFVTTDNIGNGFLRLGHGDGTFGSVSNFASASPFESIATGDLNGDGFLDLAIIGGDTVQVLTLLGNGNGSFRSAVTYSMMQSGFGDTVLLGDINGDGVLDVLGAGNAETGIRFGNSTSGIAPLLSFKLNSRAGALQALNQFDAALRGVNTQRGAIGAFQSRVGTAISTLQTGSENYAAAASRITDADFASESANLVRSKIIQFASVAVLAQANAQPGLALRLLADID